MWLATSRICPNAGQAGRFLALVHRPACPSCFFDVVRASSSCICTPAFQTSLLSECYMDPLQTRRLANAAAALLARESLPPFPRTAAKQAYTVFKIAAICSSNVPMKSEKQSMQPAEQGTMCWVS